MGRFFFATLSLFALASSAAALSLSDDVPKCWPNGSDEGVDCSVWPWLDLAWVERVAHVPNSRRELEQGGSNVIFETIAGSWTSGLDASVLNGTLVSPTVTHTNLHACPSSLLKCPPPVSHPLRFDSETLTGDFGDVFGGEIELSEGTWIVVAHLRVQETDEALRTVKYDMTIQHEITIEGSSTVQTSSVVTEDLTETTVLIIAFTCFFVVTSASVTVSYFWVMGTHRKDLFIARKGEAKYHLQYNWVKVGVDLVLCFAFSIWSALLIQASVASRANPDLALKTEARSTLSLPSVMVCPFLAGGLVENIDVSFYPNLYGFVRFSDVTFQEDLVLTNVNALDGAIIERKCVVYNFGDLRKVATSTFSTLFITANVRAADGTADNALLVILDDADIDLVSPTDLLDNKFISASKATSARVSQQEKVSLSNEATTTYDVALSVTENPYEVREAETEMVILVQFQQMSVDIESEVWTISATVTLSLIIGASTGIRLARMVLFKLINSRIASHTKLSKVSKMEDGDAVDLLRASPSVSREVSPRNAEKGPPQASQSNLLNVP